MYVKIQKMKLTFSKILLAKLWNNEYQRSRDSNQDQLFVGPS